jgi:hypothetical protein
VDPNKFILLCLAGWLNREQQAVMGRGADITEDSKGDSDCSLAEEIRGKDSMGGADPSASPKASLWSTWDQQGDCGMEPEFV